MVKTLAEINERIKSGDAVIVSADEMPEIVEKVGLTEAAKSVDIVTTGTFGAMCSSGAFLNFGHSNPPIKMQNVFLNDVEAYGGLAAVDAYIGATQVSNELGMEYGGGHVIEDLIAGKKIRLSATSYGTDCYPTKNIETELTLSDLNQAYLFNPRNNYQKYVAATNSSENTVKTYMGTLLAEFGNVNYAGTGSISPLLNDPNYETIGFGTRIFLGGGIGRICGEGTQHSPENGFGTLAVKGNLADMDERFVRGAVIAEYGTSLMVGIGIPIPILNESIAKATAITNDKIETSILDYAVGRVDRPVISKVDYEQLMSGSIKINGKKVKTASLSSFKLAFEIMDIQREWIEDKKYFFCEDIESLPKKTKVKPMKISTKIPAVGEIMTKKVYTAFSNTPLKEVSKIIIDYGVDQIPIVDEKGVLKGIVSPTDFIKATAKNAKKAFEVMTKKVMCAKKNQSIDELSRKLLRRGFNSAPVVDDEGKIIGIITLSDINRAYERLKR